MKGSTHLAAGAVLGFLAAPDYNIQGAIIGGLAALVPDWLQINLPYVNKYVHGVTGHRGISHWLWIAMIVTTLLAWLVHAYWIVLPILVGYTSHILLDMFSGGVPVLWPLPRITLARIKTGGRIDATLGVVFSILLVLVGLKEYT